MDVYKMHGGVPRPLPKSLMIGISLGIVLHLAALVVLVTAAPSGPWNTPVGPSPALAPEFAGVVLSRLEPLYFQPLQLTHNYHYVTDQVENSSVSFEVVLKDERDKVIDTVVFPQKNVNKWLQQRQRLLAQNLGQDQPVMRRQGEQIAAPGQKIKTVTIWDRGDQEFKLKQVPMHLVPENQPVSRPSNWSLIVAKSYMRYLCRKHGAKSATMHRISRDPISPVVLPLMRNGEQIPPILLGEEMKANFGDYRVDE